MPIPVLQAPINAVSRARTLCVDRERLDALGTIRLEACGNESVAIDRI
jgi:hypothetical protein